MGTATNQEKDDISTLSIHVVVVQIVQGQQGNVPENVVHVQIVVLRMYTHSTLE